VIHTLVDLLEIEMGAVFHTKSGEEGQFLELIVSYAYSENRFQKRSFKIGESLVGACAAEKRTIFLKKVPDDYLKIISGLGLASPKSILIVPLIFEGTVLGVIELGSLKDFEEDEIKFTERAAETIANTLSMAEINIKTFDLLEKTRQQTVELEERDKKMHEALNELKVLQLQTAHSEASIRAKLEAMNNTLMMVEYTTKGILLEANYKYLNTMNYSIEDIKGIDVLELLREEDRAELIKIINMVKNGNFYESVMRRHTRQGAEKWLFATYTPVYNDQNIVESILFFAIDITRLRKNEEQLKQKTIELTKQVEELRKLLKQDKP
jgi:PAS domain S-box-containing protein